MRLKSGCLFSLFLGRGENRLERGKSQLSRVVEMLIFVLSSGYTEYTMIRTYLKGSWNAILLPLFYDDTVNI